MKWRLFHPSRVVGLDIGVHEVKAVAVSSGLKGVEIVGSARVKAPYSGENSASADLSGVLAQLASQDLFPAEWLVAGLKGDQVAIRSLTLPRFKGRTGDAIVRYEMESLLPYQAEEIVVDYWVRPVESDRKSQVVAMAAQKTTVLHLLDQLARAGLESRMIGWSALGAYLALRRTYEPPGPGEVWGLLDLGAKSSSLAMFDSSGLILARSLEVGGDDLTEAVADGLRLPLNQAEVLKREQGLSPQSPQELRIILQEILSTLLREVELSRLSFQTDIDRLIITGGTAKLPGIQDFFRERMKVECTLFNPFEHCVYSVQEEEAVHGPEYAAALGLALSALNGRGERVDFRREELAFKRPLSAVKGKLTAGGAVLLAILIVLGADFTLNLKYKEERYRELKNEIRTLFRNTLPQVSTIVNEELQMSQAIEEARKGMASAAFNPEGGSLLDLFNNISRQIPTTAKIRVTELALEEQEILLVGEAGSFESVDQLKERLGSLSGLGAVNVEGATTNEFSKIIEFTIRIKRK
jgi:type IV pilus assembly protein PilM